MPIQPPKYKFTVEPVYNGHPRNLRNWPLNTGSLKILTGRGLVSISMAYHTKKTSRKKQLDKAINTLNKAQCQLATYRYNV